MGKIVFVADYFSDEILEGGAEKCNEALITLLKKNHDVLKIKSKNLSNQFIMDNKDKFFIIANFFHIDEAKKKSISDNLKYVIYEHDHKYLSTNNPISFKNFLAPEKFIINKEFYKNAQIVICQSRLHAETVYKNLMIENIVNAGANFWSDADIEVLENFLETKKDIGFASMNTNNKNKGLSKSIQYCKKKDYDLTLIPLLKYPEFISFLSRVEKFVFFPQWMESYSRVAVESRILGCGIITNSFLGVSSERYFSLKGKELLDKIKENNTILLKKIEKIINEEEVAPNFVMKQIPKITISCSLYDGDEYIQRFMEDITSQTIFAKCELIIVNANSPGNEEQIINEYLERFDNIKYHKLDYRATPTEVLNMVIDELATGEFITIGNIDDMRRRDCLEVQAKYLLFNEDVSLVYADCFQTTKPNESYESNSSEGSLYEHSLKNFSKENMIKCLPGPMPMWRRSVHDHCGLFDKEYIYANDWEMWLRMVKNGHKFQKINDILGLYYFNEKGRSTSRSKFKEKIKEESKLFFDNIDTFGQKNYQKYKNYFSQGLRNA